MKLELTRGTAEKLFSIKDTTHKSMNVLVAEAMELLYQKYKSTPLQGSFEQEDQNGPRDSSKLDT